MHAKYDVVGQISDPAVGLQPRLALPLVSSDYHATVGRLKDEMLALQCAREQQSRHLQAARLARDLSSRMFVHVDEYSCFSNVPLSHSESTMPHTMSPQPEAVAGPPKPQADEPTQSRVVESVHHVTMR